MQVLPLCLTNLSQKKAVVVGGGSVARRKTQALLDAGLSVRLIAPRINTELAAKAAEDRPPELDIVQREYRCGDLEGADLAFAATDDAETNRAVALEARRLHIPLNVADDPLAGDFFMPAVARRGELVVAVSTGGASPSLATWLRSRIEDELLPQADELAGLLAEARPQISGHPIDIERLLAAGVLEALHLNGRQAALSLLIDVIHAS